LGEAIGEFGMVSPTNTRLLWCAYALCILGLGFPALIGIPLFLWLLSAAVLGGVVWALRAPRHVALSISAARARDHRSGLEIHQ
jgi:hypothetical protein